MAFSVAAGQKIGIGRLEAELGYKKADIKRIYADGLGSAKVNGDMSALSLMGNGFIDFGANRTVKPYIMAGLGGAKLKLKSTDMNADEEDNVFAYQAGAGCGIALNELIVFDVSYRYMGTSDTDLDGTKVSYGSHNLLAGVRFNF
jgi:opacity protein-like surface antigen